MPGAKLPKPQTFEHWRNRVVCRLVGRLSREDFDFGFDTVVSWMDGRRVELQQARDSAIDIMLATTGVYPGAFVQKCEDTGVVLLTVVVRGPTGEPVHLRTRTVNIREISAEPTPEAVPIRKRNRA
jgi:hypothetical protein